VLFATLLIASVGVLISVSVLLHRSGAAHRIEMLREGEGHAVGMRQDAVTRLIAGAVSDLLFLSELNELQTFVDSWGTDGREDLGRELLAFARGQQIYRQIRVISTSGAEMLRVDNSGAPILAPVSELGDVMSVSDVQEMSDCGAGSVHVSRLRPSLVQGDAETSRNSILRLGLALGRGEDVAGFFLLDLEGEVLLNAFANAHPDEESIDLLVDDAGRWLRGPTPGSAGDSAQGDRIGGTFQSDFPDEWQTISSTGEGQLTTRNGMFTYRTLIPYAEADRARCEETDVLPIANSATHTWKNVSWVPTDVLAATRRAGALPLAGWNLVGVFVLGTGSWAFSRWLTRRSELHRRTELEKELLQSTLRKYMATQIRDRLLGDPARHGSLGGESQDVVVLFADIRGFTSLAENREPEEVVAILNRSMAELTSPLRVYGGILDKFIGDGFLAFFEPSPTLSDAARRAVESARVMQKVFRNLWADSSSDAVRTLGLGIGIGAGRVVVGNVGSEDAMDYTVVGDAVNVAARLQDSAAAGEILLSDAAYRLLEDQPEADLIPQVKLRGRRQPLDIYKMRPFI